MTPVGFLVKAVRTSSIQLRDRKIARLLKFAMSTDSEERDRLTQCRYGKKEIMDSRLPVKMCNGPVYCPSILSDTNKSLLLRQVKP